MTCFTVQRKGSQSHRRWYQLGYAVRSQPEAVSMVREDRALHQQRSDRYRVIRWNGRVLALLLALILAGCQSNPAPTPTPLPDPEPVVDRTGADGNWVGFTNSMDCFPYQGWYFWLKKDNRPGRQRLWEIYWWNRSMREEGKELIRTDVIDADGQRILLAPWWQLVRTNK